MMQLRYIVIVDVDPGMMPLGQPADVVRDEIRSNLASVDDVEACDVNVIGGAKSQSETHTGELHLGRERLEAWSTLRMPPSR